LLPLSPAGYSRFLQRVNSSSTFTMPACSVSVKGLYILYFGRGAGCLYSPTSESLEILGNSAELQGLRIEILIHITQ
jgi:hypothetical protein